MCIKILDFISKFKNRNKKVKNIQVFFYGEIQHCSNRHNISGVYMIESANNICHIYELVVEDMLEAFVAEHGGDKKNLTPIIKNIVFY